MRHGWVRVGGVGRGSGWAAAAAATTATAVNTHATHTPRRHYCRAARPSRDGQIRPSRVRSVTWFRWAEAGASHAGAGTGRTAASRDEHRARHRSLLAGHVSTRVVKVGPIRQLVGHVTSPTAQMRFGWISIWIGPFTNRLVVSCRLVAHLARFNGSSTVANLPFLGFSVRVHRVCSCLRKVEGK